MSGNLPCPICGRASYMTGDGLARHLEVDHSPAAVADELAFLAVIVRAATLPPLPATPPIPGPAGQTRCGKVRYPDERRALLGLLSAWSQNRAWRRETRAYYCHRCEAWHLTSQPAREDQPA